MIEFEYPSRGAGSIHAYRWEPAGKPVAVLQLIPGIAAHAARYDEMARFFTQRGALERHGRAALLLRRLDVGCGRQLRPA